jgi:hypothetical protein
MDPYERSMEEENVKDFLINQYLKAISSGETTIEKVMKFMNVAKLYDLSEPYEHYYALNYIYITLDVLPKVTTDSNMRKRILLDFFLALFLNLKKEKRILDYKELLFSYEVKSLIEALFKLNSYRPIVMVLLEWFLEAEKIEILHKKNEEEGKKKIEELKKPTIFNGSTEHEFDERNDYAAYLEHVYWEGVNESEIDPSGDFSTYNYGSDFDDKYEQLSDFENFRKDIKKAIAKFDTYIKNIVEAEDLMPEEKIRYLSTFQRISDLYNGYSGYHTYIGHVRANQNRDQYIKFFSQDLERLGLTYKSTDSHDLLILKENKELLRIPYYSLLNEKDGYRRDLSISQLVENDGHYSTCDEAKELMNKVFTYLVEIPLPDEFWEELEAEINDFSENQNGWKDSSGEIKFDSNIISFCSTIFKDGDCSIDLSVIK